MLATLRIRSLAIVDDLTLELGPGLNVLTGETGAGKSIVVDALGLVAGGRADTSLVRSGEDRAIVEALFALGPEHPARQALGQRGIDVEDGELTVRREVAGAGGTARVFLGGSPATLATLREVAESLLEIHGQHEQQMLLRTERHLDLLDAFGGLAGQAAAVRGAHDGVLDARRAQAELDAAASERAARAAELERVVREISSVAPRPGELAELDAERRLLLHADRVRTLLEQAVAALYEGEPSAASLAASGARRAGELAAILPELEDMAGRIDAARVELEDAGGALRDWLERAEADPARLEAVEARRAAIERLLLRHGADEVAVLRAAEDAGQELVRLRRLDDQHAGARALVRDAEARYRAAAGELGAGRRAAAVRLARLVEEQLAGLAMGGTRLEVAFSQARGGAIEGEPPVVLGARGAERAEFLLAANPGEEPRPLARIASGGELSRVMLALHGVLPAAGVGHVLVFDEVDAGVGGAVADVVGARLAAVGRRHQTVCVTHLPQVAAHADRHYHVRKRVAAGRTRVEVVALAGEERVDELARMLGGRSVTEGSRRNAAELLAAAAAAGSPAPERRRSRA